MTYRLNTRPLFWAPVVVKLGEEEPQTFRAQFEALEAEEMEAFDLSTPAGTKAFVERVLKDVDQVEDDFENAIPFDQGLRRDLVAAPHLRIALVRAYQNAFASAAQGN